MKLAKRERHEDRPMTRRTGGWSPFRQLSRLHDQIDKLFEEPLGGWLTPSDKMFEGWSPAVDVCEDKENVFVKAELPGMKKEDIDVSVTGDMLSIAGERKEESESKDAGTYRSERYFGSFSRTIPLPVSVESDKIHAEYKDGVLTITCPKTEEAKQKSIDIKVE